MKANKVLEGKELEKFFIEQIALLKERFLGFLSQFDAEDLFHKWREFIRHIDELYNIDSLTSEEEDDMLLSCGVDNCNKPQFEKVLDVVGNLYGMDVRRRFKESCNMLSLLNYKYIMNGQARNYCRTLGEAVARCQSMRLFYVDMLMLIPNYAKGCKKVDFLDLLAVFQPMIDLCFVNIRTAYNALVVNKSIDDFQAVPQGRELVFNYNYNHLEGEFLEPVRLSLFDVMSNMTEKEVNKLPKHRAHVLCGYEELIEGIELTAAAYNKYGINETGEFKAMVDMAYDLKAYLQDDYAFVVPMEDYEDLRSRNPNLTLYCDSKDFDEMINSRPAFFRFEDKYYSTVLLYQRYMVNEVQRLLEKNKKFQIDSGFIFEKEIKKVLGEFGYKGTGIKRINRKEYDVVCIKDDCIYNFQCKNNSVSVSQQGKDWFKRTCDNIRRLNKYYEKALDKEDKRANLLKENLGIGSVKSYVISRYPVITRNPRIINYNQLRTWLYMRESASDDRYTK